MLHPNQERVYSERGMSLNAWHVEQVSSEGKRPEVAAFWKQFEIKGRPPIEWKKVQ